MKVRGDNIIIELEDNGSFIPYACATSAEFETGVDMLETAGQDVDGYATFLPSKKSWNASLSGFTSINPTNQLSAFEIRQKQMNRDRIRIRFTYSDGTNNFYSLGFAYITNVKDSSAFPGFNSFSVDIVGDGKLNLNGGSGPTPPTPPSTITYEYGSVYFDTTDPSAFSSVTDRHNKILGAVISDIGNNNHLTGMTLNNVDIGINFPSGYEIKYLRVPDTIPNFIKFTETGLQFNQNVPIGAVGSNNFMIADADSGYRYYFTAYQTDFTNQITFQR